MPLAVEFTWDFGTAALGNAAWLVFVTMLAVTTPGRRAITRWAQGVVERRRRP